MQHIFYPLNMNDLNFVLTNLWIIKNRLIKVGIPGSSDESSRFQVIIGSITGSQTTVQNCACICDYTKVVKYNKKKYGN